MKKLKARVLHPFRFWLCRKLLGKELAMLYGINITTSQGDMNLNPCGRTMQITACVLKAGPKP